MRRMIKAVELFVGLRYLRAKRRTRFVSFITAISLLGIALGVAALIVILSVMNGFEGELRSRLLSMTAHGFVTGTAGTVEEWAPVRDTVLQNTNVVAASPYIEMEGMVRSGRELKAVLVNGVYPELEQDVSGRTTNFVAGDLGVLLPGMRSIVLGRLLALDLNVRIGDGIVLLIPRPGGRGDLEPVLERFVVRGVFAADIQDHDSTLALVHASDAARILSYGDRVTAVRFLADDVMRAPLIAAQLGEDLGDAFRTSDWTVENASYFRAIRLEKMMISLIVSLVIGVAAFNIVASLVMVVTDKRSEIAILRTLGLGPNGIVRVFFIQGAFIGWFGVILGVIVGVVLALFATEIVLFLEWLFRFKVMPGDVYAVTRIPSILETGDVLLIAGAAFVLTSLATLYPARRAAHVQPAAALRYE